MSHPYRTQPAAAFWPQAIAEIPAGEVDPTHGIDFTVKLHEKIATAGSCFAQHIARHLSAAGFNYLSFEKAHPVVDPQTAERFGYGLYSARYGNVYTSRQLLQLAQRALHHRSFQDTVWHDRDGNPVDAFRPQITPGGYSSVEDLEADRQQHLNCVAQMFREVDVFIFTLGLTETWESLVDGAVYPLCPGVSGTGSFDESKYRFLNLTVEEVLRDMEEFLQILRHENPKARVLLTVSPVPLNATASGKHVLSATTYSKSVLRVACETLSMRYTNVFYFPSYEIITGNFNRGTYFASDLRSVNESGVGHVMRLFMQRCGNRTVADGEPIERPEAPPVAPDPSISVANLIKVMCDEDALRYHVE
jgi:hypothetical protein